jgi:hypothetical protein
MFIRCISGSVIHDRSVFLALCVLVLAFGRVPACAWSPVGDVNGIAYQVPASGDFNKDCTVNLQDMCFLAQQWLLPSGPADLVEPNRVDMLDFATFSEDWRQESGHDCNECDNWQTLHPEWIFCDDFDDDTPLRREGRYFELGSDSGDFMVADGVGINESQGMRAVFQAGEVGAGGLKLAFGRVPSSYFDQGIRNTEDFRDIYYRIYLKHQAGWEGSPAKLSRATVFAGSNWSQAMIAHLWSSKDFLLIDPASGVDANGQVVTTKYNDFTHLRWLGNRPGTTPIFASDHDDTWVCIEVHVRLNDPGLSNGVQEFWINGHLEAQRTDLNFVGSYTTYGINAIFLENYWNAGSPKEQERYFDSFVVSTERIGCLCENDR